MVVDPLPHTLLLLLYISSGENRDFPTPEVDSPLPKFHIKNSTKVLKRMKCQ